MTAQSSTNQKRGVRGWAGKFAREQANQVWGAAHREFWSETASLARAIFGMRLKRSRRIEQFDVAVTRLGLTKADLQAQLGRHKFVHLVMYAFSGALVVYGTYLAQRHGLLIAAGAYIAAAGGLVSGYLHGFRAWQIENRNLISLQDALRIPGTYLVL